MRKTPPTAPPIPEPVLTGTARTGAALNAALARQAAAAARVARVEADASDGIVDGHALAAAEAECKLFARNVEALEKAHAVAMDIEDHLCPRTRQSFWAPAHSRYR